MVAMPFHHLLEPGACADAVEAVFRSIGLFRQVSRCTASEEIGLVILDKIESLNEILHSKHGVCAHAVCRNHHVAADQIQIVRVVAQKEDLVGFQFHEKLIDDAFMQLAWPVSLVTFELGMNPDGAVVTTTFQVIDCAKNGGVTTKSGGEIGNDPVNIELFGVDGPCEWTLMIQ